ncbi:toxin-antitoxin system TumE family protein [Candidatus Amarolinea aalborgensis]|uniref:toxin-antitoxin system TumE family protein n=1 Tax=Candidatus Amarolinea aalborgensis TaxID=2249329 RepID=UPI003BF95F7C
MNPFQSLHDYEEFVYRLPHDVATVIYSTLIIARRGARMATLAGEIAFAGGYRIVIRERLTFDNGPLMIEQYGYEAWRNNEKLYWYDSQAHPGDSTLASTHPHHKHIPPDIKHHRVPAPGLSFMAPNLLQIIREVETLIEHA